MPCETRCRFGSRAGNLILVGISYDKEAGDKAPNYKHHSCRLLRA